MNKHFFSKGKFIVESSIQTQDVFDLGHQQ